MKITILPDDRYLAAEGSEKPIVGRTYTLEDAADGSTAQRNAFHALLQEYYSTRLWSYQGSAYNAGCTFMEFRNKIKQYLGAGFDRFYYVDITAKLPRMVIVKKWNEIPLEIRRHPNREELIRGNLKSFSKYTKRERHGIITGLIAEMDEVGVNTKKYHEIRAGMEKGK